VYSFKGGSDGANPVGPLINIGSTLYGTTAAGGSTNCHGGCGTVFKVTPAGAETVLHSFKGGSDGDLPDAGLLTEGGWLYGTTPSGGAANRGTVFRLTPAGIEKVLYSFRGGSDGQAPEAGLIHAGSTFYGTTDATVFSVTPAGAEAVVYAFKGGGDGSSPAGDLLNRSGTFYGTTAYGGSVNCELGCGTVFSVTPAGGERVVYAFTGVPDGAGPSAGVIKVGGSLYGTTSRGGSAKCTDGCGTVFRVTPAGAERVVYSFQGPPDGGGLVSGLINVGGMLYGTTSEGGPRGWGTVFSVTPAGAETIVYAFQGGEGGPDGGIPYGGLVELGGTLYGTTAEGGANGQGTVFAITP
jgi:uncharacterized repeat protein (TIGR03803 family)